MESFGFCAFIAIWESITAPTATRRISRINGEKEDETLAVLGDGLLRYARFYQLIPGANTWMTNVATMTGLAVKQVAYFNGDTNDGRVYLIHSSFVPTNA